MSSFIYIGDGKYINKKYIIQINKIQRNNGSEYYEIIYGLKNPTVIRIYDNEDVYDIITKIL